MKMSIDRFPIGLEMDVSYPNFQVSLTLLSLTQLRFEIKEGRCARTEIVDIQIVPFGNSIFAVSWQEKDGATVTNVQDYDRGLIYSYATLPSGQFLRMSKLAEHWDVLQNEVPVTEALGGVSMFDPEEGTHSAQPGAQS
jgi:hypothetical protein